MKKTVFGAVLLVILLAVAMPVAAGSGNGMPSGPRYNLNIIGVYDKTAPMDGNTGGRIFVKLDGRSKIWLTGDPLPDAYFQVTDANGTDNDGAAFTMPTNVTANYDVYVRALGKPGGMADMTSCYVDQFNVEWCLSTPLHLERKAGKPITIEASDELLTVDVRVCTAWDLTGACTTWEIQNIPLFSDTLLDYFWQYDNNHLRLAQLRFYPK